MKKLRMNLKDITEAGLSLIEIVVAVGISLILAAVGVIGYGHLVDNARKAAVEDAASSVLTAAVAESANIDNTVDSIEGVADDWNKSSNKSDVITDVVVDEDSSNGYCIVVSAVHKAGISAERKTCVDSGTDNGGDDSTGESEEEIITVAPISFTEACAYKAGLLAGSGQVRVYITVPDGYDLSNVRVFVSGMSDDTQKEIEGFSVSSNTSRISGNQYQMDVPLLLLMDATDGLAEEFRIGMLIEDEDGNKSEPVYVRAKAGAFGGFKGTCYNME